MKFKGEHRKRKIPLYPIDLVYLTDVDDFNNTHYEEVVHANCGGAVRRVDGTIYIWLPHYGYGVSMPSLAHEAYHVADNVFDYVGMEYSSHSGNEHMAYLIEWVVEFVIDSLSDMDNKRKKAEMED